MSTLSLNNSVSLFLFFLSFVFTMHGSLFHTRLPTGGEVRRILFRFCWFCLRVLLVLILFRMVIYNCELSNVSSVTIIACFTHSTFNTGMLPRYAPFDGYFIPLFFLLSAFDPIRWWGFSFSCTVNDTTTVILIRKRQQCSCFDGTRTRERAYMHKCEGYGWRMTRCWAKSGRKFFLLFFYGLFFTPFFAPYPLFSSNHCHRFSKNSYFSHFHKFCGLGAHCGWEKEEHT